MKQIDRRTLLKHIGNAGLAGLAGVGLASCSPVATNPAKGSAMPTPNCILSPTQMEGPYYFKANQVRSDITEGKPGTALKLILTVVDAVTCAPLQHAIVDIWHADHAGVYSGYAEEGTTGERFLRGIQVTDSRGEASFQSLFPGWYTGRATHIHFKVHLNDQEVVTSQLYFPEPITRAIYNTSVYASRGQADTSHATDAVIADDGGLKSLLMDVQPEGAGYVARHTLGIQR